MPTLTKSQRFLVGAIADEIEARQGVARDEPPPDLGDLGPLPHEWDDVVYGQNPAPGSSYVYTVATPMTLYSVMARLTNSAAAGARTLTLQYQDGNGSTFAVAGANVTAGALDQHSWCWSTAATVGSWEVGGVIVAPLPVQPLRSPWRVVLSLGGTFDTGDQIDTIRLAARFAVPREPLQPSFGTTSDEPIRSVTTEGQ